MHPLLVARAVSERIAWLRRHPGYRATTLPRAAVWAARAATSRPTVVPFAGGSLFCPAEQRGMARLAFVFGDRYEPELGVLSQFVKPGETALDIGANYGAYTVALAGLVGAGGLVVAFEPSAGSAAVLRRNVALNAFKQVEVREVALSDRTGTASFVVHPDSSRSRLDDEGGETVRLARLDDIDLVTSPSFIKLDVEGGEVEVLRGAEQTIARARPVILYEQTGQTAEPAWGILRDQGYRLHRVQGKAWTTLDQPPAGVANVLALPG